ncbi:MAG TPA: carboxypeptidase-like regulatory domain-containing protein, partial [Chitinophaga sp.]
MKMQCGHLKFRQCLLIIAVLVIPWRLSAQTIKEVKGTVNEESTNTALPGVTVKVKGAALGATTDEKGAYVIHNVPEDATLVFTFVGYQTVELKAGKGPINVQLKKDVRSLDNVVVVGYGTQSKRNVTGSISRVDMAAVEDLPVTNVSQALRGRVAGVQFNDDG